MTSVTFLGVIESLKQMDFQNADILDLFHAVRLEWGAIYLDDKVQISEHNNPENFLVRANIKDSKITKWQSGPACTPDVLEEILRLAKEMRAPIAHSHVLSRIMFSQRELLGRWRFKEHFQIVPCVHEIKVGAGLDWHNEVSANLDDSDPHGPPYPFLLEVSVPKISNPWLQMQIGMKQLDYSEHMLCTFVKGVSNTLLWPNERQWTALKSKDDSGIEYHLLHSGIGTQRGGQYDSWTEWSGKDTPVFEGNDYIDSLLPYRLDELVVPDDLGQLFEIYFRMNERLKRKFSRAAYFFTLGQKLRSSFDLAVLNFAIAVECLLEADESERCSNCGKDKVGPTRLFRAFMDKYAVVNEPLVDRRNKLYAVRSLIAHGARSMKTDFSMFSLARDRDTPLLMEWLVRKSLVGWLRDQ